MSCFITTSNLLSFSWKIWEKIKPTGFPLCWSCEPRPGPGYWKWKKMVEADGAYKHGRYEILWLISLRVMPNVQVLPCKTDGQRLAGRTEEHDWFHWSRCYSYGSKMIKEGRRKKEWKTEGKSYIAQHNNHDDVKCQLPMLPESASSRSDRIQRTSFCHRTEKNETVPWQIPSAWRNWRIPLRRWRQGKLPDQMKSQEKCWKHLEAYSRAVLLKIFNHIWMKGVVPAVWKEAMIIPVRKKGKDMKNPRSYWSAEEGKKMVAAQSTSDTQMVTPLPSRFLVAFRAPTIKLKYRPFAQL